MNTHLKRISTLVIVFLLLGCETKPPSLTLGRYCLPLPTTSVKLHDMYQLNFGSENVSIENSFSSYLFRKTDYVVEDQLVTITGKGTPFNDSSMFVLVFKIEQEALVFTEAGSSNYEFFEFTEGTRLTLNCPEIPS